MTMTSYKAVFTCLSFLIFFVVIFLYKIGNFKDLLKRNLTNKEAHKIQQNSFFGNILDKDVILLYWMCIPPKKKIDISKCEQPMQNLVVYNTYRNYTTTLQSIKVTYRTESIPKSYKILSNHTMIVNSYSYWRNFWPDNLFHFVTQYYIPSHHLVDVWKTRKLTQDAHLYFTKAIGNQCVKIPFASFFFKVLVFF